MKKELIWAEQKKKQNRITATREGGSILAGLRKRKKTKHKRVLEGTEISRQIKFHEGWGEKNG